MSGGISAARCSQVGAGRCVPGCGGPTGAEEQQVRGGAAGERRCRDRRGDRERGDRSTVVFALTPPRGLQPPPWSIPCPRLPCSELAPGRPSTSLRLPGEGVPCQPCLPWGGGSSRLAHLCCWWVAAVVVVGQKVRRMTLVVLLFVLLWGTGPSVSRRSVQSLQQHPCCVSTVLCCSTLVLGRWR